MQVTYYVKPEEQDLFTLELLTEIVKKHNKEFMDVQLVRQHGELKAIVATPMVKIIKSL